MQGGEGEGAAEGGNWWEGRPLVLVLFLEGDKEGQQLLGLLVVPGPCCHSLSRGSLCMRCPWPTGLTAAHPLTQTTLPSSNLLEPLTFPLSSRLWKPKCFNLDTSYKPFQTGYIFIIVT